MLQLKNKMKYFFIWRYIHLQDLKNLLFSISRFAYFGAIASLLNFFLDVHEIYLCFQNIHIYKNDIKIKTAIIRGATNLFLGLTGFFPLFILFAWALINPLIIPIFSLSIVGANLFQAYRTFKITQYELSIDITVLKNNADTNSSAILTDTKMKLYTTQKNLLINGILTLGSAISAFGVFFPPLLVIGMGLAVTASVLGILDNQLDFGIKIIKFFERNTINKQTEIQDLNNKTIHRKIKNSYYYMLKHANRYQPDMVKKPISQQSSFTPEKELIKDIFVTIKEYKQESEKNKKTTLQMKGCSN
jgi:hypothetical protein